MFNEILILRIILISVLYLLITINDIKHFKIPNYLLVIMAIVGIVFNFLEYSFITSILILLISIIGFIAFAWFSSLRFKGMQLAGAGDLKLILATFIAIPYLAGIVTNIFVINVLLFTSIFSAIYSVWVFISSGFDFFKFGKKLYELKLPFSLFLFLGFVTSVIFYIFL